MSACLPAVAFCAFIHSFRSKALFYRSCFFVIHSSVIILLTACFLFFPWASCWSGIAACFSACLRLCFKFPSFRLRLIGLFACVSACFLACLCMGLFSSYWDSTPADRLVRGSSCFSLPTCCALLLSVPLLQCLSECTIRSSISAQTMQQICGIRNTFRHE